MFLMLCYQHLGATNPTHVSHAGLDSTNAANIVDILAELARSGCNVILTIHQPRPDVFRLMDSVLLMSGNGQVGAFQATSASQGRSHHVVL